MGGNFLKHPSRPAPPRCCPLRPPHRGGISGHQSFVGDSRNIASMPPTPTKPPDSSCPLCRLLPSTVTSSSAPASSPSHLCLLSQLHLSMPAPPTNSTHRLRLCWSRLPLSSLSFVPPSLSGSTHSPLLRTISREGEATGCLQGAQSNSPTMSTFFDSMMNHNIYSMPLKLDMYIVQMRSIVESFFCDPLSFHATKSGHVYCADELRC